MVFMKPTILRSKVKKIWILYIWSSSYTQILIGFPTSLDPHPSSNTSDQPSTRKNIAWIFGFVLDYSMGILEKPSGSPTPLLLLLSYLKGYSNIIWSSLHPSIYKLPFLLVTYSRSSIKLRRIPWMTFD